MSRFLARGSTLALGVLATLTAASAFATDTAARSEAFIPFANHGGIWNWEADRDKGLWIQSNNRKWYYATFLGPCIGLNFANSVAFDTRPMGTFDKFSAVFVPGWGKCQVQTFEPSDGPPVKKKANG
jgi:hypothetical protein